MLIVFYLVKALFNHWNIFECKYVLKIINESPGFYDKVRTKDKNTLELRLQLVSKI